MKTDRFETFLDAIIAIIITVLVLKIAQPEQATWGAIWALKTRYLTYFLCFVMIFNTWYNDHNFFLIVDEISNHVVIVYGLLIFIFSLLPYFSTWLILNFYSIPAQTMFGILFILTNILYTISSYLICKANPYNKKLKSIEFSNIKRYAPIIIILIGFLFTYTIFVPAIYVACLISTLIWIVAVNRPKFETESSERFEALIDAIVAIILTIIVLEITMASGGSWENLFDLHLEFFAYAISFIVAFNFWNYNNNMFSIVNKIDYKVIWSIGLSLFVLSLIPYLSNFVAENFYSFVSQLCYGIDFIIVALLSIVTSNALLNVDKGNIALSLALRNNYHLYSTLIIVSCGIIIGYFLYPPAIIMSCLISILVIWIIPHIYK